MVETRLVALAVVERRLDLVSAVARLGLREHFGRDPAARAGALYFYTFGVADDDGLTALADEARERITRALEEVAG